MLAIDAWFDRQATVCAVVVPARDGATLAWLHRYGRVIEQEVVEGDIRLTVRLEQADVGRLRKRLGDGAVLSEAPAAPRERLGAPRPDRTTGQAVGDVDGAAVAS